MMGCQTPNIDRLGEEGAGLTDYYPQQSCTAHRAVSSPAIRPGKISAGKVLNGIVSCQNRLPMLPAAAGDPTSRENS
jgi:hypothetical protein